MNTFLIVIIIIGVIFLVIKQRFIRIELPSQLTHKLSLIRFLIDPKIDLQNDPHTENFDYFEID